MKEINEWKHYFKAGFFAFALILALLAIALLVFGLPEARELNGNGQETSLAPLPQESEGTESRFEVSDFNMEWSGQRKSEAFTLSEISVE